MRYCSLQSQSARRGFTLIELITVMALISILASFFVMDSSNARRLQRLDVAANTLVSTIREVQAWGQSGRGYGASGTDFYDRGYGVYVTTDTAGDANRKIVIYGGVGTGPDVTHDRYTPTTNRVSEITLPAGVLVKGICVENGGTCTPGKNNVHILTRRGSETMKIHNFTGGSTQWHNSDYTEITLEAGSDTRTVVVNKFGLVYVE